MPVLDGLASIPIGLVLAATAALLARESKSLLIGERADEPFRDSQLRSAEAASPNAKANLALNVQLAPDRMLVALSLVVARTGLTSAFARVSKRPPQARS